MGNVSSRSTSLSAHFLAVAMGCVLFAQAVPASSQLPDRPCPSELHVSIVFDQSYSVLPASDSTQNEYTRIIDAFLLGLEDGDRIDFYSLPGDPVREIERAGSVILDDSERSAGGEILATVTRNQLSDSDLGLAVRRVRERLGGAASCSVLVLVTDGSLSPFQGLQDFRTVGSIAASFDAEVDRAENAGMRVYAIGFRADKRRAIDTTYWRRPLHHPGPESYVFKDLDLYAASGAQLLHAVFSTRYFAYNHEAVENLLFFSPAAIYRTRRDYVSGLAGLDSADQVIVRLTVQPGTPCALFDSDSARLGESCTFRVSKPSSAWIDSLKERGLQQELDVVFRLPRTWRTDGILADAQYPHQFVLRGPRSPLERCTTSQFFYHLAMQGIWPPARPARPEPLLVWESDAPRKLIADTLAKIGDTGCYAPRRLDELSGPAGREVSVRDGSVEQHLGIAFPKRSPVKSGITASQRIGDRDVFGVSGWLILPHEDALGRRLFLKGASLDLDESLRGCPVDQVQPEGEACYRVRGRVVAPGGLTVGLLIPLRKQPTDCKLDCLPVTVRRLPPRVPILWAVLCSLAAALVVELLCLVRPDLRRVVDFFRRTQGVEHSKATREPGVKSGRRVMLSLLLNTGVTGWLFFASYVMAEAEAGFIPGESLSTLALPFLWSLSKLLVTFGALGVVVGISVPRA